MLLQALAERRAILGSCHPLSRGQSRSDARRPSRRCRLYECGGLQSVEDRASSLYGAFSLFGRRSGGMIGSFGTLQSRSQSRHRYHVLRLERSKALVGSASVCRLSQCGQTGGLDIGQAQDNNTRLPSCRTECGWLLPKLIGVLDVCVIAHRRMERRSRIRFECVP
jgi:hypothetical protein